MAHVATRSEPGLSYENWQRSADYEPVDISLPAANPPNVSVDAVAELAAESRADTDTTEYVHLEPVVAADAPPPPEYTTLEIVLAGDFVINDIAV